MTKRKEHPLKRGPKKGDGGRPSVAFLGDPDRFAIAGAIFFNEAMRIDEQYAYEFAALAFAERADGSKKSVRFVSVIELPSSDGDVHRSARLIGVSLRNRADHLQRKRKLIAASGDRAWLHDSYVALVTLFASEADASLSAWAAHELVALGWNEEIAAIVKILVPETF